MLFASKRLFTGLVTWPLKLSMMITAGVSLQVDSRTVDVGDNDLLYVLDHGAFIHPVLW